MVTKIYEESSRTVSAYEMPKNRRSDPATRCRPAEAKAMLERAVAKSSRSRPRYTSIINGGVKLFILGLDVEAFSSFGAYENRHQTPTAGIVCRC